MINSKSWKHNKFFKLVFKDSYWVLISMIEHHQVIHEAEVYDSILLTSPVMDEVEMLCVFPQMPPNPSNAKIKR